MSQYAAYSFIFKSSKIHNLWKKGILKLISTIKKNNNKNKKPDHLVVTEPNTEQSLPIFQVYIRKTGKTYS